MQVVTVLLSKETPTFSGEKISFTAQNHNLIHWLKSFTAGNAGSVPQKTPLKQSRSTLKPPTCAQLMKLTRRQLKLWNLLLCKQHKDMLQQPDYRVYIQRHFDVLVMLVFYIYYDVGPRYILAQLSHGQLRWQRW